MSEKIEYLEDGMSGRRHQKSLLCRIPPLTQSLGGVGNLLRGGVEAYTCTVQININSAQYHTMQQLVLPPTHRWW